MRIVAAVALLTISACRSGTPEFVAARPVGALAEGDCVEARRRAALEPGLDVDQLPSPVKQKPRALQRVPADVKAHFDTSGAAVRVEVLIDTLGRADMKTFKVVESSHPWLASNVKSVLPGWTFKPAKLAGCKVKRVYKFSATAPARLKTRGLAASGKS